MKKLAVCFFLLLPAFALFGQSTAGKQDLTYEKYMKKSIRQNKFGWILLGGGIGVSTATILAATQLNINGDATLVLLCIGVGIFPIAIPLSMPFFISAHHNKKKAMSLSVKNETAFIPCKLFRPAPIPSFSLKINL